MINKRRSKTDRGDDSTYINYTEDELEFMKAIERYRKENDKRFLAWRDVLEVVRSLGYRKEPTIPPTE